MNKLLNIETDMTKITIGNPDDKFGSTHGQHYDCNFLDYYKDIFEISTLEGTGQYPEYALANTSFLDYNSDGDTIHIRRILVEGWLFKKGSGIDLICNRGWKPRWGILAMTANRHFDYEVPALIIYWNRSSSEPSTYLPLMNAIVMDGCKEDSEYFPYRFTVVPNGRPTRHFSAPQRQRDEWVHCIQIAIRDFLQARKRMGCPLDNDADTSTDED